MQRIRRVTTIDGGQAWLVDGYATAKALLRDHRLGRSHPDPGSAARISRSTILDRPQVPSTTEDEDHRKMRRLLLGFLSGTPVTRLRSRVRRLVDELLGELCRHGSPVDFHALVSEPLPASVSCELLGVPRRDRLRLQAWSAQAADVSDRSRSATGLARLTRYMTALLDRGRDPDADDLLTALGRQYPPAVAARTAAELFIAGHQTTTAAIDKGLVLLLSAPPAVRSALRTPEAVAAAVEEMVRLPDPVASPGRARLLLRYARSELRFDGETVRPGELVLLAIDEANLDGAVFPDPGTPDFGRSPNAHLGFGHGPYACVGAALGRLEMRLLFTALPARLPDLELAVPVGDLCPRTDQLMGGIAELPVRW